MTHPHGRRFYGRMRLNPALLHSRCSVAECAADYWVVETGFAVPLGEKARSKEAKGLGFVGRQTCAAPPSANTSLPVMKLLSSEARKSATAAVSLG